MRSFRVASAVLCAFAAIAVSAGSASAAGVSIDLFHWTFNVDGRIYDSFAGLALPLGTFSGTPAATGPQGTIAVTVTGAGTHKVSGFYDYEMEILNSSGGNGFTDETGTAVGTPATGQSWELGNPCISNPKPASCSTTNIYSQFTAQSLDNTNHLARPVDDVSAALGWTFSLTAGQTATITFTVASGAPPAGFYLIHSDPISGTNLYDSSSLSVSTAPSVVKLNVATTPSSGKTGVAVVNITGSGFPVGHGTIAPANVTVTLSLTCGGLVIAQTVASSVAVVLSSTSRVGFTLPPALPAAIYFASISGKTPDNSMFNSTGTCSEVSVTP